MIGSENLKKDGNKRKRKCINLIIFDFFLLFFSMKSYTRKSFFFNNFLICLVFSQTKYDLILFYKIIKDGIYFLTK